MKKINNNTGLYLYIEKMRKGKLELKKKGKKR